MAAGGPWGLWRVCGAVWSQPLCAQGQGGTAGAQGTGKVKLWALCPLGPERPGGSAAFPQVIPTKMGFSSEAAQMVAPVCSWPVSGLPSGASSVG